MLNQDQFVEALCSNWITSEISLVYNPAETNLHEVRGEMRKTGETANVPFTAKIKLTDPLVQEILASGRVSVH